jgi:dihydroorotate dehydrogenase electron transfer subunit
VKDTRCRVDYQVPLGDDYYRMGLETHWKGFVPGQFGMLQVPQQGGIILRRPFSFARQLGAITEILYKVVGKGTRILSQVPEGSALNLLGPLGHGFSQPQGSGDFVAIAGGYGIAPFVEMAKQFQTKGQKLSLFYGAKTKKDLIYIQELKELNVKLYLTTMDGSEGHRGLVTELLEKVYEGEDPKVIWSCGPTGLLKAVLEWSRARKVACEVSVEESMGCGTGVCLGCVVKDAHNHYVRACVEGPVFSREEIRL